MVLSNVMAFGSSRGKGTPVKTMSKLARLFEGWQAGVVVIVTAVLVALVVIPRPELPTDLPLPRVDPGALSDVMEDDARRAREAEQIPLPFEVRAVGDAFRTMGRAAAEGDQETVQRMRFALAGRLPLALQYSADLLLQLRAYQTRIFLRELAVYEASGVESAALQEVGGDFLRSARDAGWIRWRHGRPTLLADNTIRSILFRKRWNDITKLQRHPFRLSIAEERAFHAFLFQHPVVHVPKSHRSDPGMRCRAANQYLLRRVDQYARLDPAYPADYAKGILLLRMGRHQAALIPLVRFLESNPDGQYTLRARNALRYAHQQMHDTLAR